MSGSARAVVFGPGSLESIRLERRRFGARRTPDDVQLQARARGTFRVFCGAGNDHTTTIAGDWFTVSWPQHANRAADTRYDFTNADLLATELVEAELEGWQDPCEGAEADPLAGAINFLPDSTP